MPNELAFDLIACADSEVALGESRLQWQSSFSQLRLSENRRKQFFIFNNAARCMQRRRQCFPTVRTVGSLGNGEVRAKMAHI
jgi:hypothetical protein